MLQVLKTAFIEFTWLTAPFFADMFLALDKDMNGTLSKQELREYADGTLTEIFIERGRKQHQVLHKKEKILIFLKDISLSFSSWFTQNGYILVKLSY